MFWPRGPFGIVVGWFAAAVMVVAFVVTWVALMVVYAVWLILLAAVRAARR